MKNSNSFKYSSDRKSPQLSNTQELLQTQKSYVFRERSGSLKWKEIMRLDIDGMIRSNNLNQLEPFLDNLIFSDVRENVFDIVSEEVTCKLIKMYQHILEYFIHLQQVLENDISNYEQSYNNLVNDTIQKDNILKDNKIQIQLLKKDKRDKEIIIGTYKSMIDNFKRKGLENSNPHAQTRSRYPERSEKGERHECKYCVGKAFVSLDMLNKHIIRRHPNQTMPENFATNNTMKQMPDNNDELNMSIVDKKIFNLNSNFEKYIKAMTEPLINYMSQQKNLEAQISEIKHESKIERLEMEGQVKNILLEIKEMYLNKTLLEKNALNSASNFNETAKYDSELFKLTNALSQMKSQLEEMAKNQKDLATHPKTEQVIIYKVPPEEAPKEKKKIKEEGLKQSNELQMSFNKIETIHKFEEKEHIEIKKKIVKTKTVFNAGPLESDNEEKPQIKKTKTNSSSKIVKLKTPEKKVEIIEEKLPTPPKIDTITQVSAIEEQIPVNNEIIIEENHEPEIKEEESKKEVVEVKKEIQKPKEQLRSHSEQPKPKVNPEEAKKSNQKKAYDNLAEGFNTYMARDKNFEESFKKDFYQSIT